MSGTSKHHLVLMFALVWRCSASFVFTNPKITQCARDARANGTAWLTANTASYICTDAQWDKYYNPASTIAPFLLNDDASASAQAVCPKKGDVIKCFAFASWGQVAGGPDACGDSCSTAMGAGSQSCCAKACTSSGNFPPTPSPTANCTNNKWKTSTTAQCGSRGDGYCDCCPNCYDCVHGPPPPSPAPSSSFKSYVANRFCDCRKGLEVSPDYSPCWNSCMDCFGDDGQVDYMPEDIAETCIGKGSCYVFADYTTKKWQSCTSSKTSSCTPSSKTASDLPNQPKAKGMILCGSPDEGVVV